MCDEDRCQPGNTRDWPHSHNLPTPMVSMADLVLDAAAACQLVAVGDSDDDRWLEEEWIPSLKQKETKGQKGFIKQAPVLHSSQEHSAQEHNNIPAD